MIPFGSIPKTSGESGRTLMSLFDIEVGMISDRFFVG